MIFFVPKLHPDWTHEDAEKQIRKGIWSYQTLERAKAACPYIKEFYAINVEGRQIRD